MLKQKALRKIFITTLTMFIILTIYTIPFTSMKQEKVLRTNLEVEDITNLATDKIYLLNKNDYLVETEVFIDSNKIEEKIEKIINYLTIDNDKIPKELNGYIPKNTKLINYNIEDKTLTLNFSKEFLNYEIEKENTIITGIVFSLLEINNVENITILVEDKLLKNYVEVTRKIGINNKYLFTNRNDIKKVIIYYLDDTNTYYVPVTKYLNDKREKIEIIIDELNNNISNNLISLLDNNIKLLDYKEESNVLFLNFNEYLKDNNEMITEKNLNTIAYSVFDNYDVGMVMFEIDNKLLKYIERK